MLKRSFFMILMLGCFGGTASLYGQDAILNEMYKAFDQANEMAFQFRSFQRLDSDKKSVVKEKLMNVQMTHSPMKIEMELIFPRKGLTVSYNETKKPSHARVSLNLGIGSIPKDLFIYGSTIMADTHHPVTATGFKLVLDLLAAARKKAREAGSSVTFEDKGKVSLDGRSCRKIEIRDSDYKFVPYTVKAGESVMDIGRKHSLSAYKIMKLNPEIEKSYRSIEGQTIQVPTFYGKNTWIYIDQATKLPYMVEVHDDKGLFEKFYYLDVKLGASEQ